MISTLLVLFAFGLVISGVVLLGVQQALDWAKEQADLTFPDQRQASPAQFELSSSAPATSNPPSTRRRP
jgi:hypothetical protein